MTLNAEEIIEAVDDAVAMMKYEDELHFLLTIYDAMAQRIEKLAHEDEHTK